MGSNAIDRFEFRFQAYIYRSIRTCLNDREGVAASILLCCAIDVLSKYKSGDGSVTRNKQRYVKFIRSYFPFSYDPESFYSFVRSGLLHSFNMEKHYIILCNNEVWAKRAHLQFDAKHKLIVVNPFVLFRDLHDAFKKYIADVRHNMSIQKSFFAVHHVLPLKRQQISWRKMKHLK